jgi:hypothetical protein
MKKCEKCGKEFKLTAEIDGQKKNLQNRKYCLSCSPWGKHNTRKIHIKESSNIVKKCKICGKDNKAKKGCKKCYACYQRTRIYNVQKRISGIVGKSCWLCGYDKCERAIDFHHIDPSKKEFNLTANIISHAKWDDVYKEIKKCVRLCCRCHREYHDGIVDDKLINEIWSNKWTEIMVL